MVGGQALPRPPLTRLGDSLRLSGRQSRPSGGLPKFVNPRQTAQIYWSADKQVTARRHLSQTRTR